MKSLLLCLLATVVLGRAAESPALPRVLLIGDSISFGYAPTVISELRGVADVQRIEGTVAATLRPQGGLRLDTVAALEQLDHWLGDKPWTVIHFNWGLHDLKLQKDGSHQVPVDQYERNLRELVRRLKATGATLIWASTTPVPSGADHGGFVRKAGDEVAYNAAAERVMRENQIPIDDLHALVAPHLAEVQLPGNVHFKPAGYKELGTQVAAVIRAWLPAGTAAQIAEIPWPTVGHLVTRPASAIRSSSWSIGCETLDRDYAKYDAYRAYVGPLGAKKARVQIGWAKTEPKPGVYNFGWVDDVVNDLRSQGVAPWLELAYGNPIYPGGGGKEIGSGGPTSPVALAAWDRWVHAAVGHFGSRVQEWEIWNEPDGGKMALSAASYHDLLVRTARIVRQEQPKARIDAFALATHMAFAREVLDRLQADGDLSLIDAITVHAYPLNPDNVSEVEKARALVAKYPRPLEVIMGETGAPSTKTSGALRNYAWTELTQAKWDLRRLLAHRAIDAPMSLFSISDFSYPNRGLNTKGLLQTNPDLSIARAKPAYAAAQRVFSIFDDTVRRRSDVRGEVGPGGGWACTTYEKPGAGLLAAVWANGKPPEDSNHYQEATLRFPGVRFQKPVLADLRTGVVYAVPVAAYRITDGGTEFSGIPLYDSPVLIADRAALSISR